MTNMLLHDIDNPEIIHGNTLETDYKEYRKQEKFDVVLMNPPYGGNEKNSVKANFPMELRSSETADLFMNIIMFRLKKKDAAQSSFLMGFCLAQTMQRSISRQSCLQNLTCIQL